MTSGSRMTIFRLKQIASTSIHAAAGAMHWNYDRAAHLIERAGFGAPPEEIERVAALTPDVSVVSILALLLSVLLLSLGLLLGSTLAAG